MTKKDHLSYYIKPASTYFSKNGLCSEEYDDIFFNNDDPVAESEYVYVDSLDLDLIKDKKKIVVAEIGFGAGLNFLLTCKKLAEHSKSLQLYYVAFEKHLIPKNTLIEFYKNGELEHEIRGRLIDTVQRLVPGLNRIQFKENVTLLVAVGAAEKFIPKLKFNADAWYMDGFAPSKNPELWSADIISDITKNCSEKCTLASFSCAGDFRRSLESHGWTVERPKGFGYKREMLRARFVREPSPKVSSVRRAVVIGAGIAGCSLAYCLSKRGISVDVYDSHGRPAQEASGNPLALLMPDISREEDARTFLLLSGMNVVHDHIEALKLSPVHKSIIRFPTSERLQKLCELLEKEKILTNVVEVLPSERVKELVPSAVDSKALFFPNALSIRPQELCDSYLSAAGLTVTQAQVTNIEESLDCWEVKSNKQTLGSYEAVFVANAYQAQDLISHELPFRKNFGQILSIKSDGGFPDIPICFQGYLASVSDDESIIGATYEHSEDKKSVEIVREELWQKLSEVVSGDKIDGIQVNSSRGTYRSGTPDRLPMVGPLFSMGKHFYLSCCFGSRGFTLAPLAAEYLAAIVAEEPWPIDSYLANSISPERY